MTFDRLHSSPHLKERQDEVYYVACVCACPLCGVAVEGDDRLISCIALSFTFIFIDFFFPRGLNLLLPGGLIRPSHVVSSFPPLPFQYHVGCA